MLFSDYDGPSYPVIPSLKSKKKNELNSMNWNLSNWNFVIVIIIFLMYILLQLLSKPCRIGPCLLPYSASLLRCLLDFLVIRFLLKTKSKRYLCFVDWQFHTLQNYLCNLQNLMQQFSHIGNATLWHSSLKNVNYVINYSPSCRSKPVRPSFFFRTQVKIFLMHPVSSLTLPQTARILTRSRLRNGWMRSFK